MAAFILLAGSRDSLAEVFLKSGKPAPASLIILLFAGSAMILGALVGHSKKEVRQSGGVWRRFSEALKEHSTTLIGLNLVTAGAYGLALFAIASDLGAALNGVIDYGLTPVFILLLAKGALSEKIGWKQALAALMATGGVVFIAVAEFDGNDPAEYGKAWGIAAALAGSLFGALIHFLNKKAVAGKIDAWIILVSRMLLPFAASAILVGLEMDAATIVSNHLALIPYALVFFALPLYFLLVAFRSVELGRFAIALYLVPLVTITVSGLLGRFDAQFMNIVGTGLILIAIFVGIPSSSKKA